MFKKGVRVRFEKVVCGLSYFKGGVTRWPAISSVDLMHTQMVV